MENEVMINEEVVEAAAEVVKDVPKFDFVKAGKTALMAVGVITVTVAIGKVVNDKVVKPLKAKRKAKKEAAAIEADFEEIEDQEIEAEKLK